MRTSDNRAITRPGSMLIVALVLAMASLGCPGVKAGKPTVSAHRYECDEGPSRACTEALEPTGYYLTPSDEASFGYKKTLLEPECARGERMACSHLAFLYTSTPDLAPSHPVVWQLVERMCGSSGGIGPQGIDRDCAVLTEAVKLGLGDTAGHARWADEFVRRCAAGKPTINQFCEDEIPLRSFALHPGDASEAKVARSTYACGRGLRTACLTYLYALKENGPKGNERPDAIAVLETMCELGVLEGCAELRLRDPARAAASLAASCNKGNQASCGEAQALDPVQQAKLCEQADMAACGRLQAIDPKRAAALLDSLCEKGNEEACVQLLVLVRRNVWHPAAGAPSVAVRLLRLSEKSCFSRGAAASCVRGWVILKAEAELSLQLALRARFRSTLCSAHAHKEACSELAKDEPTTANLGKACSLGDQDMCIGLSCSVSPTVKPKPAALLDDMQKACAKSKPSDPACLCLFKHGLVGVPLDMREFWDQLKAACATDQCKAAPHFSQVNSKMMAAWQGVLTEGKPKGECTPSSESTSVVRVGVPGKDQTEWKVTRAATSCGLSSDAQFALNDKALRAAMQVLTTESKGFCPCPAR